MPFDHIINQFDYQDKGYASKIFDTLLTPFRCAWGGKTITCLDHETGESVRVKGDKLNNESIEFHQSRQRSYFFRACAGVASLVLLPFTGIALLGKAFSSENKPLADRYISPKDIDKRTQKDRLSNSIWCQFAEGIAKKFNYEPVQLAAHIQADYQMGHTDESVSGTDLKSKDLEKARKLKGGLFFISAKSLRQQLEKYVNDATFGQEIKKALKVAHEYERWSLHMASIMPFRLMGINPKGLVQDLAADLKDRLKSLEKGEGFLVPVNLRPRKMGFHTITVEMKKEEDGSFSLTVNNLGLGCSNHQYFSEEDKYKIHPFRITNIPEDKITDVEFLKKFIDHATFKDYDKDGGKFYQFLENTDWSSQAQIDPLVPDKASASTYQRSGICIWKNALEGIRHFMSPQAYTAFVFAMKRDNILHIYDTYLAKPIEKQASKKETIRWTAKQEEASILVEIGISEFNQRIKKNRARHADAQRDQADQQKIADLKEKVRSYREKQKI